MQCFALELAERIFHVLHVKSGFYFFFFGDTIHVNKHLKTLFHLLLSPIVIYNHVHFILDGG